MSLRGQIQRAVNWLQGQSRNAGQGQAQYHSRPQPGSLYLFRYHAKWDEKLPYWDKNPLMMPIDFYDNGWLGLNFHYLPPVARKRLFDYLKYYTRGQGDQRKIEISYGVLNRVARDKRFQPCVKRYLYSQVRSKFAVIPPDQWDRAIMLPTQKFTKASAGRVWRNSMRR